MIAETDLATQDQVQVNTDAGTDEKKVFLFHFRIGDISKYTFGVLARDKDTAHTSVELKIYEDYAGNYEKIDMMLKALKTAKVTEHKFLESFKLVTVWNNPKI